MFSFCVGFRDWHLTHLERCLYFIERIAATDDEIIVCDLGSKGTVAAEVLGLTRRLRDALFVSAPSDGWSRAEALNRAAAQARRPLLVLADADTLLPICWAQAIAADLASDPASPLRLTRSRDMPDTRPSGFPFPGVLDDAWLYAISTEHPETGQGAAMVARRDWFSLVGGFDEAYRTWSAEDNDLALRAEWDTDAPVRWVPGAWAAHQWHPRDWATAADAEQVRRNREYLAARIAERGPVVRNLHLSRGYYGERS